jgi:hypothetical protein
MKRERAERNPSSSSHRVGKGGGEGVSTARSFPKTLQLEGKSTSSKDNRPQRSYAPEHLGPLGPERLISSLPSLVRAASGSGEVLHLNMAATPSMATGQRAVFL